MNFIVYYKRTTRITHNATYYHYHHDRTYYHDRINEEIVKLNTEFDNTEEATGDLQKKYRVFVEIIKKTATLASGKK